AASGIGLANSAEARAGFLAETIEFLEGEAALDLDVINLRELGPGFKHGGGEIAIVGEKDEAGIGVVEGADGINAFGKAAEEIAKCAAALGIGEGAEFGDDLAVDAHLARENELLGVAARGDAGVGDDFLEAVEHGDVQL